MEVRPALGTELSANTASVTFLTGEFTLESGEHQEVLETVHGVDLLIIFECLDNETVTWLVVGWVFDSNHFNSNFVTIESINFIESAFNRQCAGTVVQGAHGSAVLVHFVSGNLAFEVGGDSHLQRPGDLDGSSLGDGIDRGELNGVVSHVVEADVSLS